MQPPLHKTKAISLRSESLLGFNLSFSPVSIFKSQLMPFQLTTACCCPSVCWVAWGRTQSQNTPPMDMTITFSQLGTLTQQGLERFTRCDYEDGGFCLGTQEMMPLNNSKCISLDTVVTLIIAKQDWGSELKLQERQSAMNKGLFSVHRGGSVLRYYIGLILD